jgi:hypothetical protein
LDNKLSWLFTVCCLNSGASVIYIAEWYYWQGNVKISGRVFEDLLQAHIQLRLGRTVYFTHVFSERKELIS